jgi:uncharacterized membrane protein YhaH (DUF805 family)
MRNFWAAPFRFDGRIGRKRYWIGTLLYLLGGILSGLVLVTLAALNYNPPADTITNRTIVGFVLLGIAMVGCAVAVVSGSSSTTLRRTGCWPTHRSGTAAR